MLVVSDPRYFAVIVYPLPSNTRTLICLKFPDVAWDIGVHPDAAGGT